jgi:hypothetical protein
MGMNVSISTGSGFIRVTTTGDFSLREAKRTFLEVLEATAQHKAEKVLIDGREIRGTPAIVHRFFYGEFAADSVAAYIQDHGVPANAQFAYVLLEPVLHTHRFGETVAVNRGMWVKAFDNLEEALGWLTSGSRRETAR